MTRVLTIGPRYVTKSGSRRRTAGRAFHSTGGPWPKGPSATYDGDPAWRTT